MARLAKQYSGESARESRSTSQEDHLRRVNGQLSEHLRRVESSLNTLEKEHHEMTKQTVDTKMQMARTEDEKEQLKHELAQLKSDFEKHQREIHYYYQSQLQNVSGENKQLHDQNDQLSAQLTETETMLINMKINFAERESEFDRHRLKQ
jgi:chromosome segregation ATPase